MMAEAQYFAATTPPRASIPFERARGLARIAIRAEADGRSRLDRLYQSGSAKIRLPRIPVGAPMQAILLNTAGGVTGGDEITFEVVVADGAAAVIATQAAERIYRRAEGSALIATSLSVGADARLDWLPQETILFDRSSLQRRLTAEVHPTSRLLAVEAVVLGRAAMGEAVRQASLNDVWRIRRNGRLVFADASSIEGDTTAVMGGRATGNGAAAFATVILVSPDAETKVDRARAALADARGEAGASAWNGMLVARLLAPTGQALREDLVRLLEALRGEPMPRVWSC